MRTRSAGCATGQDRCTDSECCCGHEGAVRADELDEQSAGECGDGECRVGRAVLRGEDTAADLIWRASLNERHGGDITEPPARAGERHASEADRQYWGG